VQLSVNTVSGPHYNTNWTWTSYYTNFQHE